jgi:hypothetical protein
MEAPWRVGPGPRCSTPPARRAPTCPPSALREDGPQTACMLCVVRDAAADRLVLSCALPPRRMEIVTDDRASSPRAVRAGTAAERARRDCEGPCERICPAGLHIPLMLRTAQSGDAAGAAALAARTWSSPRPWAASAPPLRARVPPRGLRRGHSDSAPPTGPSRGPPAVPAPKPAPSGRTVGIAGPGSPGSPPPPSSRGGATPARSMRRPPPRAPEGAPARETAAGNPRRGDRRVAALGRDLRAAWRFVDEVDKWTKWTGGSGGKEPFCGGGCWRRMTR